MTKKEAIAIAGTLGEPSKMPCYAYGLPAAECKIGSQLRDVRGSVCEGCYALSGNYRYANVQTSEYRRLGSITNPQWTDAMVALIGGARGPRGKWFRWHDSGDLQSVAHLVKIAEIARRLPKVKFWLPTREYRIVAEFRAQHEIPSNLVIRLSAHMVDQTAPAVGLVTSMVYSGTKAVAGVWQCPAPKQGNQCGKCRACWSADVQTVAYHKH